MDFKRRQTTPIPVIESGHPLEDSSFLFRSRGIHSISISQDRTRLVTGTQNSIDLGLYTFPELKPCGVLQGHSDVVFAAQWIAPDLIVSASRDRCVGLWKLRDIFTTPDFTFDTPTVASSPDPLPSYHPIAMLMEHKDKVRDLKFDQEHKKFVTVSMDTTLKVWDTSTLKSVRTVPLIHSNETVCMSLQSGGGSLCAVGSQHHISFFDFRMPYYSCLIHTAPSLDDGDGVRSLAWQSQVLTVGGGSGKLSFYDMRRRYYLRLEREQDGSRILLQPRNSVFCEFNSTVAWHSALSNKSDRRRNQQSIMQYTDQDSLLGPSPRSNFYQIEQSQAHRLPHWTDFVPKNAIYTLSYDDSGTRLFTAGGALHLGLKGAYAAMWQ